MNSLGLISFLAGALQLSIPSYALRLVRRFGAEKVGWFLVSAFACLGLLHVLDPLKFQKGLLASTCTVDAIYAIGSVLLLIGMAHVETLVSAKLQAANEEKTLQRELKAQVQEKISALEERNLKLAQEIASRAERERVLQELEAQYRFLFVQNPQPMWIVDLRSSRFLAVNKSALSQSGFSEQELMNLGVAGLMRSSGKAGFLEDLSRPCSGVEVRGRWSLRKKDGTILTMEITAVDMKYGDAPARLILASDITLHAREMQQALETQRLELIGKIAGGVAHHFNNILTVISGHTEILTRDGSDPELAAHLNNMSAAAHRGACLTRQLLAAGGEQMIDLAPVDLHACLQRLQPTVQRLLGSSIFLRTRFSNSLPAAMADARALEQMVVALVLNGRDAMSGKGELTLSTRTVKISQEDAGRGNGLKPGDYVCLKVADTGCGMSPEVQARIYEPFFTTKDVGRASGLGLASVYGLARQQSGWIEWRSEVQKGTEVELFLPCAPKMATPTAKPISAQKPRTVLLVEPDERARALGRYILNRLGHTVIECDSAALAWNLWESEAPRIELLLTAVTLPAGVTGQKLAKKMQSTKPGLKVLYMCGDSDSDKELRAGMEMEHVVAKPYTGESMLKSIENVLGEA